MAVEPMSWRCRSAPFIGRPYCRSSDPVEAILEVRSFSEHQDVLEGVAQAALS